MLGHLIDETPSALQKLQTSTASPCDVYVVIADEGRRAEATGMVQRARDLGVRVDFPLKPAKVARQFEDAVQLGASQAVVVGAEWPLVKWKTLATRAEEILNQSELAERMKNLENI